MWIIASIPFWIIGALCLLGAWGNIKWKQPTTDAEVWNILLSLFWSGIFFLVAAKVAS